jgi:hypothetical protein
VRSDAYCKLTGYLYTFPRDRLSQAERLQDTHCTGGTAKALNQPMAVKRGVDPNFAALRPIFKQAVEATSILSHQTR